MVLTQEEKAHIYDLDQQIVVKRQTISDAHAVLLAQEETIYTEIKVLKDQIAVIETEA